jgi:hypothetical protein
VLAGLLTPSEEDGYVLTALAVLGATKQPQHSAAVQAMLQRPEHNVRTAALHTLGIMGARDAAGVIADLAGQTREHPEVRVVAVEALAALQMPDFADLLLRLLSDEEAAVRAAAVLALGKSGSGSRYLKELRHAVDDQAQAVRIAAIESLGAIETTDSFRLLMNSLLSPKDDVRLAASVEIIRQRSADSLEQWSVFLEAGCRYPAFRTKALSAGLATVRNAEKAAALRFLHSGAGWQGYLQKETADQTIRGLLAMVQDAQRFHYDAARKECADAIADAVALTSWTTGDLCYLDGLADEVGGFASHLKAGAIRDVAQGIRERDPVRRALRIAGWALLIQPLIWVLVLLVYPWSALAQGMVWTRWFRRLAGFGWVGPLVVRVPWLRERMWRPFREALVPPGEVVSFDEWTFFDAVRVSRKGGESQPALTALEARGVVTVLRGESGLGETTLLQARLP